MRLSRCSTPFSMKKAMRHSQWRTLTIVNRTDAKQRDIPVRVGNEPTRIPKTDEMVTQ